MSPFDLRGAGGVSIAGENSVATDTRDYSAGAAAAGAIKIMRCDTYNDVFSLLVLVLYFFVQLTFISAGTMSTLSSSSVQL